MIEYFIAKRYLKSKRRLNFITVISRISVVGVSLGVAALLVVLSVFNGFGELAKKMMLEAEPHIQVKFTVPISNEEIAKIKHYLANNNQIESFNLYSEGKAIIGVGSNFDILTVKGIEDNYFFSKNFRLKRFADATSDVSTKDQLYLSLYSAVKLNARLGDTVSITSFQNLEKSVATLLMPKIVKLKVAGIFSTGNNELNSHYIFIPLSFSKYLFSKKNRLSGIEIYTKDFKKVDLIKQDLKNLHLDSIKIFTWKDTHKQLLTVMQIERWSAYLLLSLIIAIASFNILSSLTMSVTVKRKDIAVMRSFGLTTKSIKNIFLFEGLLTGLKGAFWGFAAGIFIYFLQLYFHIYPLDPTKYIIDAIPVKLYFSDIIAITLMALFLSSSAAIYPAIKAAKTNIIEAIKWE